MPGPKGSKAANPIALASAFVIVLVFSAVSYRVVTSCEVSSFELLNHLKVTLGGCSQGNPKDTSRNETRLDLYGVVEERKDKIKRVFTIDETNSDHNTLDTNTKSYSRTFRADDDFKITAHDFYERSATRVSDFTINIDGGGDSIVVNFKLKCGPKTDRYRGWLKGDLTTTQERLVPTTETKLASGIRVVPEERIPLPDDRFSGYQTVKVLDQMGNLVATGPPLAALDAPMLGGSIELVSAGGRGFLVFSPSPQPALK